ncbi:MAG: NADPH:quinone reductase [Actinomycetia bacterium]|nr:NADPH:quinone reductase [Actinomycetes bacterium]
MKAVRFDRYGSVDVLDIADVPVPAPGPGQVLVKVMAAGINPGEAKIREGLLHELWPATFPSGEGTDLAGIVESLGPDVDDAAVGDEVVGWVDTRSSHAEYAVVEAANLARKPPSVTWEVAGAIPVAGFTAWAAVRAVDLKPGDTVVVSGAAGGVGSIAVQLARRTGARVWGLASEANHEWLEAHGVLPVSYKASPEGMAWTEAVQLVNPGHAVDAFIDTYGGDYVEIALNELGVAPERVDTIVRFDGPAKYGIKAEGNAAGASAETLAELAALIAAGDLEIPIVATYPLAEVRAAYERLETGHVRGKIVLVP